MLLWSSVHRRSGKKKKQKQKLNWIAWHARSQLRLNKATLPSVILLTKVLTWVCLVLCFLHFCVFCWWFCYLKWSPSICCLVFLGARRLRCALQRKCVLNNFVQARVISAVDHKFNVDESAVYTKWSIFKQKHAYNKVMYSLVDETAVTRYSPAPRSNASVFANSLFAGLYRI